MKRVSGKSKIPLKEAKEHYQSSCENYDIEGSESHLAYYREKHPIYYSLLLQNV